MEGSDRCTACGAPLHLLTPECPECGTDQTWELRGECPECGRGRDFLEPCRCGAPATPWRALERVALADGTVSVAKDAVSRPTRAGYGRHLGTVKGQWADYRRDGDAGEFHVVVFLDHYELHVDDVGALESPTGHAIRYAPTAIASTARDAARGTVGRAARGVGSGARWTGGLVRSVAERSVGVASGIASELADGADEDDAHDP
jgi:hypothetical protein